MTDSASNEYARICSVVDPKTGARCDRTLGHPGRHSWELDAPREPVFRSTKQSVIDAFEGGK